MDLLKELNQRTEQLGDFWDALEVVSKDNGLDNDDIETLKEQYDQQSPP
ncbi:MAG: hypothetical protein V3T17_19365 [Pseudomonadales bacterium]